MKKEEYASPNMTVCIYQGQLRKFYKLGIGNKTENGVEVTQQLIDVTKKRLSQLVLKRKY